MNLHFLQDPFPPAKEQHSDYSIILFLQNCWNKRKVSLYQDNQYIQFKLGLFGLTIFIYRQLSNSTKYYIKVSSTGLFGNYCDTAVVNKQYSSLSLLRTLKKRYTAYITMVFKYPSQYQINSIYTEYLDSLDTSILFSESTAYRNIKIHNNETTVSLFFPNHRASQQASGAIVQWNTTQQIQQLVH